MCRVWQIERAFASHRSAGLLMNDEFKTGKLEILKLTVFNKWIDYKYLVEIVPKWDQSLNHLCHCQLQTLSMHYLRVLEHDVFGRKDIIAKVNRTIIFFTIGPSLQLSLKICTDTPLWQAPGRGVSVHVLPGIDWLVSLLYEADLIHG